MTDPGPKAPPQPSTLQKYMPLLDKLHLYNLRGMTLFSSALIPYILHQRMFSPNPSPFSTWILTEGSICLVSLYVLCSLLVRTLQRRNQHHLAVVVCGFMEVLKWVALSMAVYLAVEKPSLGRVLGTGVVVVMNGLLEGFAVWRKVKGGVSWVGMQADLGEMLVEIWRGAISTSTTTVEASGQRVEDEKC